MTESIKPVLNYKSQIEHLTLKGLTIHNPEQAAKVLSEINYYRLINAYGLGLYTSSTKEYFKPETSFEQIYSLYQFDERLRHLVAPLIETFEISFRTKLAYTIAINEGPLGYMNVGIFENENYYSNFISSYEREKQYQHKSPIVKHHLQKYGGMLPIWAVVELLSFGTMSKLYYNLNYEYRTQIAKEFGTSIKYMPSWLVSFVEVRNICAHYGRLYNKKLIYPPRLYSEAKEAGIQSNTIFAVLLTLRKLIGDSERWLSTCIGLQTALKRYPVVQLHKIGFPENWSELLAPS